MALIIRLLKPGGRAAVVLPDGTLFGEGVKTRLKEHLLEECNLHTIVRLPNSVFKPYASIGTNLLFFEKGEPTSEVWFYEHRVPAGQKAYSMTRPIRFEHLQPCIDWWGGPTRKDRIENEVAWKVGAEDVKARNYNLDIKNPHTVNDDHGNPEEWLAKLEAAEGETARLRDQLKGILEEALLRANARFYFNHLPRLTTCPDHIKQLRQTIFDLAVRGRLVPQDPTDELELAFDRALPAHVEPPWDIPPSWKWARLNTLGKLKGGGTPSKARDDYWNGDIPWVSPKDMKVDYLTGTQMSISEAAIAGSPANLIEAGSVLFVVRGMILAHSFPVAVTRIPLAINQDMKALVLKNPEMAEFLLRALKGLKAEVLKKVRRSSHGTCRLEGSDYGDFLIPIPPLGEQRRIVARVDELMVVCDRLEASLAEAEADSRRLLEAVLHEALASATDRAFEAVA